MISLSFNLNLENFLHHFQLIILYFAFFEEKKYFSVTVGAYNLNRVQKVTLTNQNMPKPTMYEIL